ncbi:Signal transduction histidine kinase [Bifidobacterium choerinum]|uniref:histidine kinase n=1 Tax=Bifidobacterium choerinum TaxID=35760 RepID=A0A087ADS0_9BIFI|nr:Signal transduction histidine kinase [Bifidobacterium choerinum]
MQGRWPRTRRARIALAAVPCAASAVAAMSALAHATAVWPPTTATLVALLLVPLTAATSIAGWMRAAGRDAQRRYRALADLRRERLRLTHARINDVEASRASDLRRARLSERIRIAREIHDNVGHTLTRAIMMTQADQVVATTLGDDMHAAQFAQIGATLDEAMTMIRRSVHDLKDEGTDFQGMMEDAAAVPEGAALQVRLDDGIRQAPSALAHCFAAVIREALTNTVRHGTALEATVRLIDLPGLWQLVVQDDGGKPERTAPRGGIGLADIEERARALGGTATCGPYAQGWRVFVSVPKTTAGDARETAASAPAYATERTEE